MIKKFVEWLNYQYPATRSNLEIRPKIEELLEEDIRIVKKYRDESKPEIDRIVKNIIIELAISHKK